MSGIDDISAHSEMAFEISYGDCKELGGAETLSDPYKL